MEKFKELRKLDDYDLYNLREKLNGNYIEHKFNVEKTVRLIPVLVTIGLLVYAIFPFVFPNHVYTGLVIGTVIFSASSVIPTMI